MEVWIALAAVVITVLIQTVLFAFYMGKQSETISSLKRRVDTLEGKPVIDHAAKLAAIDVTLTNIEKNQTGFEERIEARFASLEGTFRNMVQLATSPSNRRRPNDG